jgi:hypothetical protein
MSVELEDLVAPPAREDFRERLWERAEERERIVGRRWRSVALVALTVALGASTAAGVLAFGKESATVVLTTYDRTMSCPVAIQGGVPVAYVRANANYRFFNNGQWFNQPGFTGISDRNGQSLGGVGAVQRGYGFATSQICKAAKTIPLTPSGLPREGVYIGKDDGLGGLNGAQCLVGSRVTVRVRASIGRNETPVAGKLALWTGTKKLRPVAFVEWTPKRTTVYLAADCRT